MAISALKKAKLMLHFGSVPRINRILTCAPKYASQAEMYLLAYQWHQRR